MSDRLNRLAVEIEAWNAESKDVTGMSMDEAVGERMVWQIISDHAGRLARAFESEGNEEEMRAAVEDTTARLETAGDMWKAIYDDLEIFNMADAVKQLRAMQAIGQAILEGRPEPTDKELGLTGCFLATAVHGSKQARDVVVLRRFRDRRLHSHHVGRRFIRGYEWTSPPLARLVRRSKTVRALVAHLVVQPAAWMADRWLE
jgi:hypothetical protein